MFLAFLFRIISWQNRIRSPEAMNATAAALASEIETQAAPLLQLETAISPTLPQKSPPPAEQTPIPHVTPAAILNASKRLDNAIEAWRSGDWDLMRTHLRGMVSEAGNDQSFYEYVYQVIAEQGAWRIGYELAFHPPQALPYDLNANRPDELHNILYHFALDPGFADVMENEKNIPLLTPARIRHAAYFGDIASAKQQLGEFLDGYAVRTRFPEAQLLEAEVLMLGGDPRGQNLLNAVPQNMDLPEWVRAEAALMLENGLPQINKP